jgi:uncharacterized protein
MDKGFNMTSSICTCILMAFAAAAASCFVNGAAADEFRSAPVRDRDRSFQRDVWSWTRMQQRHIIMQQSDFSCGAASLATIAKYYWGDDVDEAYFLEPMLAALDEEAIRDREENGFSMTDLRRAAVAKGYLASMGRRQVQDLYELRAPVIVRVVVQIAGEEHEHFVVLRGIAYDRAFLADPIRGNIRVPLEQFAGQWEDRTVLVLVKRGADLRDFAPLMLDASEWDPVRPELQVIQRHETLPPTMRRPPRRP